MGVKLLDFIERWSFTPPRSMCSLKRRSVSKSHITSGFLGSLQGVGSEVGEGGWRERGAGQSHRQVHYMQLIYIYKYIHKYINIKYIY